MSREDDALAEGLVGTEPRGEVLSKTSLNHIERYLLLLVGIRYSPPPLFPLLEERVTQSAVCQGFSVAESAVSLQHV